MRARMPSFGGERERSLMVLRRRGCWPSGVATSWTGEMTWALRFDIGCAEDEGVVWVLEEGRGGRRISTSSSSSLLWLCSAAVLEDLPFEMGVVDTG